MIWNRCEITMNPRVTALTSLLLLLLSTVSWRLAKAETEVWWSDHNETQSFLENELVGTLPVVTAVTSAIPKQPSFSCPIDCLCQNAVSVDCRGTDISNVTNFLLQEPIIKL